VIGGSTEMVITPTAMRGTTAQRVAMPANTPICPDSAMVASAMSPVSRQKAQPTPKLAMARPLGSITLSRGRLVRCRLPNTGSKARHATSTADRPSHTQAHVARVTYTVVTQMTISVTV
jgi:hypothetical protein